MQRYDFVPRIESVTQDELERLRRSPKGGHIDIILRESLLDAEYDMEKARRILSDRRGIWTINSFTDVNPHLKESCEGNLVRSEFLLLRYLGDEKFEHSQLSEYIGYLEGSVFDSLPQNVIYRLCDYNDRDFGFLHSRYESRGAARLIEHRELLDIDMKVVRSLMRTGRKVGVLVPHVLFPEEFKVLKRTIRENLGDVDVGTMLEVPANLLEVQEFSDADFYVFGPGDLARSLYGGVDRNSSRFNDVNHDLVLPMVLSALERLEGLGEEKTVYMIKNLIGRDFGEYKNLKFVEMFMPSQLLAEARKI